MKSIINQINDIAEQRKKSQEEKARALSERIKKIYEKKEAQQGMDPFFREEEGKC